MAIPELRGPDDGSGDDEDGMEISNLEVENPASNVVTIADVNDDISVQTFQVLTCDAFSNSNARPLSIIRAQGLIWVRFLDVSAGRRGFGALGAVWKRMRIAYRFDGEFDEALLYTTDIWLRDEDANPDTIMGDSEALGEGSGHSEETTTRPLSPPPREVVSASIAAPEVGTQLLTRPLSPPPRELVSAGSAAPGWGIQPELNWEASAASTSNNATSPSEETSTARPPPRVEARSPPTEPKSM
jgi:hypothetical protein